MKKTLIIIASMAGMVAVSQAATSLVAMDTMSSTSGDYTLANGSISSGVLNINNASGVSAVTLGGGAAGLGLRTQTGANGRVESAVTMTISNLTMPASGNISFFDAVYNNAGGTVVNWGIGMNSAGQFVAIWNNASWATIAAPVGFDWTSTFTITATVADAGTSLYINGVLLTTWGGLKGSTPNIGTLDLTADKLYIGGAAGGTNMGAASFDVDNLYVDSGVMTAAEVLDRYNHIQSLPEPTTATLGLLGLAGLMIRRRK